MWGLTWTFVEPYGVGVKLGKASTELVIIHGLNSESFGSVSFYGHGETGSVNKWLWLLYKYKMSIEEVHVIFALSDIIE